MKRIIIFSIILLFIIGSSKFLTGYVDLGDDPSKIKGVGLIEILYFGVSSQDSISISSVSFDGKYIAIGIYKKTAGSSKIFFYTNTGTKIHEISNAEFLTQFNVSWFPNSSKFLYRKTTTKEIFYFDINTRISKTTGLIDSKNGHIFDITKDNELVILGGSAFDKDIYLFNTLKKTKVLLGSFDAYIPTGTEIKLINKKFIIFKTEKKDVNSLWSYNFETKKMKNIFPYRFTQFYFKKLRGGKDIIIVHSNKDKNISIIDPYGKVLSEFKAGYGVEEDEMTSKGYYNFCEPEREKQITVSPNGKLFFIRLVRYYRDGEGFWPLSIMLYNSKGRSNKILGEIDTAEEMFWSPEGDKLLLQHSNSFYVIKLKKI